MDDPKISPIFRASPHWRLYAWISCALFAVYSARAADIPHNPRHFDLPGGDAAKELNAFAAQSGIQLLFDYTLAAGMTAHPVIGDLAPLDALSALVKGLPLSWTAVNDHTLAVVRTDVPPGPPPTHWWQRVFTGRTTKETAPSEMSQVLITGEVNSLNQPQPVGGELIRLDRRADIEATGFATTQDFLHTLPQVFGGGPAEDTQFGREALTNSSKGVGVNLRGLDAGATLVLWNGYRLAPSGTSGAFVDISNLPLSAIDHIDILPAGAGLEYGADAIGGVVNFVTRSNFAGFETQVLGGGVTSGSLHESAFSQVWGTRWGDGGHAIAGFEFYHRDALPAMDRSQETGDLSPFGGSNFELPYGSPGTIYEGSQTWALSTRPGSALIPGTVNLYDQDRNADILPRQQRWNLYGSVRQSVGESLALFADLLYGERQMRDTYPATIPLDLSVPSSNPFYENPSAGTEPVALVTGPQAFFGPPASTDELHSGGATVGFNLAHAHDWLTTGYLRYTFEHQRQINGGLWDPAALADALADSNADTAFDPFGGPNNPATLAGIARSSYFRLNSGLFTANLSATGPLLSLPSGTIRWTLGGEYRDQTLHTFSATPLGSTSNPSARLGRTVRSAFSELFIPLGPKTARPGIHHLELSIGGRYDDYSDIGGATVPQIGFTWAPIRALALRGSWSKTFRPPALPDSVRQNSFSELTVLEDSSSPTGQTTVLSAFGANPDLRPERSRRWTMGAELAPSLIDGLSLAVDYFHITTAGRIDQTEIAPDVLDRADLEWLVTRDVTPDERAALCARTSFLGTASSCLTAPIGAILDDRLQNLQSLTTSGIDLLAQYALPLQRATVTVGVNGTYLVQYTEVPTPVAAPEELLNTPNYPINLHLRGSLAWDYRGLGASLFLNFTNGYRDPVSVPQRSIRSWTTFDLQLRYGDEHRGGVLDHAKIALNIHNLLNHGPPFVNNPLGVGFDQANADLLGRTVTLQLIKNW